MKQQHFLLIALLLFMNSICNAQIAINTTGASPDPSAMLDVSGTTRGALMPRMTGTQMRAIGTPATGLMAYRTDSIPGLCYYDGATWKPVGDHAFNDTLYSNLYTNGYRLTADGSTGILMPPGTGGAVEIGDLSITPGNSAIEMGYFTIASGQSATTLGRFTQATNNYATAMGLNTIASGTNSTAMGGYGHATGASSTVIGYFTQATGTNSTAMGDSTTAGGTNSFAAGDNSIASGANSIAMGWLATAQQDNTIALGYNVSAGGNQSLAMGSLTNASGDNSTAMGDSTNATGNYSTTMGYYTHASGDYSTAMGASSHATGSSATAMGFRATASGEGSVAMGEVAAASGFSSTAMGYNTTASGQGSTAMGYLATASGDYSTAIGLGAQAQGANSTAMGNNVTATSAATGSFIIGDNPSSGVLEATYPNEMMMRFANGYILYTSDNESSGVLVGAGGNSWSTVSDRRKKENLAVVNGEEFLKKIDGFTLSSWNYKGQDAKIFRHYGPMAQDFYAAFGKDKYGTIGNDTTINQADMEGVSFIAIQALERRTQKEEAEIKEQAAEIKELRSENEMLKKQAGKVAGLSERLDVLEASLNEKDKVVTVK